MNFTTQSALFTARRIYVRDTFRDGYTEIALPVSAAVDIVPDALAARELDRAHGFTWGLTAHNGI